MNDWVIGNVKRSGFYRVNYDENNWNLLIEQLNDPEGHQMIDISNKAQLIDDAFNLGKSGTIDQTIFLRLANYLQYENNGVPFLAFERSIVFIERMMWNDTNASKYLYV